MGGAQTPHFYDFRIFEPVSKPQNQFFLSLETAGHLKQIKKKPWNILNTIFINVEILETHKFDMFRKGGRRKIMKIRLRKHWICISHLSKT